MIVFTTCWFHWQNLQWGKCTLIQSDRGRTRTMRLWKRCRVIGLLLSLSLLLLQCLLFQIKWGKCILLLLHYICKTITASWFLPNISIIAFTTCWFHWQNLQWGKCTFIQAKRSSRSTSHWHLVLILNLNGLVERSLTHDDLPVYMNNQCDRCSSFAIVLSDLRFTDSDYPLWYL
jgi:hypothetical protein